MLKSLWNILLFLLLSPFNFLLYLLSIIYPTHKYLCFQGGIMASVDKDYGRAFITIAMLFENDDIDRDLLIEYLKKRLYNLPFKSIVKLSTWKWPYYLPYEKVDVNDHVREEDLEGEDGGTLEELNDRISEIASIPLDWEKPMYGFHLIHGYNGKGCAVVCRLHHCVVDGFDAVKFFFHCTRRKEEMDKDDESEVKIKKRKKISYLKMICPLIMAVVKALVYPLDSADSIFAVRKGFSKRGKGALCPTVFSEDISVNDIKAISKKFHCKFGVSIMSGVALGIRKYMIRKGTKFDKENIKNKVTKISSLSWLNTRRESFQKMHRRLCKPVTIDLEDKDFNVDFGVMFLKIPMHLEDHKERIKFLNNQTKKNMYSPEAYINSLIMKLVGFMPSWLGQWVYITLGYKTSFSISNVPGPQHVRTFCGVELSNLAFWVTPPPLGTITHMITIYSYNGRMSIAMEGLFSIKESKAFLKDIVDSLKEHLTYEDEDEEEKL